MWQRKRVACSCGLFSSAPEINPPPPRPAHLNHSFRQNTTVQSLYRAIPSTNKLLKSRQAIHLHTQLVGNGHGGLQMTDHPVDHYEIPKRESRPLTIIYSGTSDKGGNHFGGVIARTPASHVVLGVKHLSEKTGEQIARCICEAAMEHQVDPATVLMLMTDGEPAARRGVRILIGTEPITAVRRLDDDNAGRFYTADDEPPAWYKAFPYALTRSCSAHFINLVTDALVGRLAEVKALMELVKAAFFEAEGGSSPLIEELREWCNARGAFVRGTSTFDVRFFTDGDGVYGGGGDGADDVSEGSSDGGWDGGDDDQPQEGVLLEEVWADDVTGALDGEVGRDLEPDRDDLEAAANAARNKPNEEGYGFVARLDHLVWFRFRWVTVLRALRPLFFLLHPLGLTRRDPDRWANAGAPLLLEFLEAHTAELRAANDWATQHGALPTTTPALQLYDALSGESWKVRLFDLSVLHTLVGTLVEGVSAVQGDNKIYPQTAMAMCDTIADLLSWQDMNPPRSTNSTSNHRAVFDEVVKTLRRTNVAFLFMSGERLEDPFRCRLETLATQLRAGSVAAQAEVGRTRADGGAIEQPAALETTTFWRNCELIQVRHYFIPAMEASFRAADPTIDPAKRGEQMFFDLSAGLESLVRETYHRHGDGRTLLPEIGAGQGQLSCPTLVRECGEYMEFISGHTQDWPTSISEYNGNDAHDNKAAGRFWETDGLRWPTLRRAALAVLALAVTTAEVERLFSTVKMAQERGRRTHRMGLAYIELMTGGTSEHLV